MTPSLLLVPSARKSGKLYSVLPIDGSGDLTFTRASTAIETNGSNLLSSVATGVPRLDYTDSSCPKLLLEPARTNLLTYSEQFDNAAWTKIEGTITPNAITSPDGTTTADQFIESVASNVSHGLARTGLMFSGTAYSVSYYVKYNNLRYVQIFCASLSESAYSAKYDLLNGVITNQGTSVTAKIEPVNNGYYRISMTTNALPSNTSITLYTLDDSQNRAYTGTGRYFYIWGAQVEVGSYPSSYIPTTSATATRVAESASLTDLKTKGLIGATEGSIGGVFSSESLVRDGSGANLLLGTSGERLEIRRSVTTAVRPIFALENASLGALTSFYSFIQDTNKWIFSWDASGWFLSVNGSIVASGIEVFTFPNSNFTMNGASGKWELNNLYSYTTKLTEDEAIQKTGFTSYEIMANELGYTID